MSFWGNLLGRSLGLLGKPFRVENTGRKFGSATEYVCIQLEAPEKMKIDGHTYEAGEEFVVLLTANPLKLGSARARKNPEDVKAFLDEHSIADSID